MNTPVGVLALAVGRVGVGATVFVAPSVLARGMGVDAATAQRTAWVARLFAIRDVALGVGLVRAARRSPRWLPDQISGSGVDAGLREALLLGALCDAGDAVAVAAALRARSVRPVPALLTLGTALGAAGLGVAVALR